MVRFYTPNLDEACDALDLYDIDYDLDKSVLRSLAHFVVPSLKTKHPALSGVIHATVAC